MRAGLGLDGQGVLLYFRAWARARAQKRGQAGSKILITVARILDEGMDCVKSPQNENISTIYLHRSTPYKYLPLAMYLTKYLSHSSN